MVAAVVAIGLTSTLAWVGLAPEAYKTAKAGQFDLPTGVSLELKAGRAFAAPATSSSNVSARGLLPEATGGRSLLSLIGAPPMASPFNESMPLRFAGVGLKMIALAPVAAPRKEPGSTAKGRGITSIRTADSTIHIAANTPTWSAAPSSGNWNTAMNWVPATVPNGPADTATFSVTTQPAISFSANTEVNSMTFLPAASAYTFTTNPALTLTISGTGIANNSGVSQHFVVSGNGSVTFSSIGNLDFTNGASAGSATAFTNRATVANTGFEGGGETRFHNTSSAGSGTFISEGGSVARSGGGGTFFFDSSSAGSGNFTADGAHNASAGSGETRFFNNASAGTGTFTTNGGTVPDAEGGFLVFADSSSAANGTFVTKGGVTAGDTINAGSLFFQINSTAANGHFTSNGGYTVFGNSSTAANGTFTNNAGTTLQFGDSSTAGSGSFTNIGTTINFSSAATAATGNFNNNATTVTFANNATAGTSIFNNTNGTTVSFADTSKGGSATLTNDGGAMSGVSGSSVTFNGSSDAATASITNNAGTVSGALGGATVFNDTSFATGTKITNSGASVSGAFGGVTSFAIESTALGATVTSNGGSASGAGGGVTQFFNLSAAVNSILIANGGSAGGSGGSIVFIGNARASGTQVEVFGNGNLDISPDTNSAPSVEVSSLDGDGNVFLGANRLRVGNILNNNPNSNFSGVIQDGGKSGGAGGSLEKAGNGTLTLSGANTYTGGTIVTAGGPSGNGTLLVNNTSGSGTGTGPVAVNAGTLGGTSNGISGPVTIAGGAVLNPGISSSSQGQMSFVAPGTALTLQSNSTFHFDLGGTAPGNGTAFYDQVQITNNASIAGTVTGSVDIGFTPSNGNVYYILTIGGTRTGVFANAVEGATVNLGNGYAGVITYQANWTGTQAGSSLFGGNDVAIFNVVAVPEPSTYPMLLIGVGLLFYFSWSKRKPLPQK